MNNYISNTNIENSKDTSPNFREIERVSKQVKEELKRFNKKKFYEKNGEEVVYNMDTVKQYLWILKEKKTRKELVSKNSSAMIMAVQIALYSQNYSFWSIDGILGEKTKAAIRKFQTDNNLPVDTFWRSMPSTIEKLLEIISRKDQIEIPEEEKKEAEEIMEEKKWNKSDAWNVSNEQTQIEEEKKEAEERETENDENNENKENTDTQLDQNTIRPEVEEWIKYPNKYSNKFKELTEITLAEAKAIHRDENKKTERWISFQLNLSWIKKILPETFWELLKHKWWLEIWIENLTPELAKKLEESWKWITFSWLGKIDDMEVYQILWKTTWFIRFSAIKNISPKWLWELIKKPQWDIYLNWIEEINPEIAEKITDFPRDILMDWIKKLNKETATILANKKSWKIYLRWLETPLTKEVLDELIKTSKQNIVTNDNIQYQINNHRILKEREWKDLSKIVLDVLDGKDRDELSKLDHITDDDADFLAKKLWGELKLSWIKEISPETFWKLLKHNWLITIWIENLTPELANVIVDKEKNSIWNDITFSWLESINIDTYKILWQTKWTLRFNVLRDITAEEIWELFKKPSWRIYLDAVEEINPEIAEKIASFTGAVSLNWIKNIDAATAQKLSEKKSWELWLTWLELPLSDDTLEGLIKIPLRCLKLNKDNLVFNKIREYKKLKEESEKINN